jgi:hypothetical protein
VTDYHRHATTGQPRRIDTAPLQRLLQMAGPLGAPAIIAAFLDDLKTTEIGLDLAWNGPDCAALRLHAHVLVALAGTVGDVDLHDQARHLNTLARDEESVKILAVKAPVMDGLADLIATLAAFSQVEE